MAQNALELGSAYALDRKQFGKQLVAFPRVAGKLAWMAVETMVARQLSYFAAAREGFRPTLRHRGRHGQAALAARVAWANADNALQIHGGNGYAQEYPISRVLCDARILNIFEGAAEIQAQVIARGLDRPAELGRSLTGLTSARLIAERKIRCQGGLGEDRHVVAVLGRRLGSPKPEVCLRTELGPS